VTTEEADALVVFDNGCTCGGYAWRMNGRPESQPHQDWCPQHKQYGEWFRAKTKTDAKDSTP